MVERIKTNEDSNFGFNASIEQYEDLVKGRRDRSHQRDAHGPAEPSIASLMLTGESTICWIVEEVDNLVLAGQRRPGNE